MLVRENKGVIASVKGLGDAHFNLRAVSRDIFVIYVSELIQWTVLIYCRRRWSTIPSKRGVGERAGAEMCFNWEVEGKNDCHYMRGFRRGIG